MDVRALARSSGLFDLAEPFLRAHQVRAWRRAGFPTPAPSSVKRELIRQLGRSYEVLVETRTYRGDTVRGLRHSFARIISIEVDEALFWRATHRCSGQENAELLLGDSAVLLPQVLKDLDAPAIFWLDAHWSGGETGSGELETPVVQEIREIVAHRPDNLVLVDDLREFVNAKPDYPTLNQVRDLAAAACYETQIGPDIIAIRPMLNS